MQLHQNKQRFYLLALMALVLLLLPACGLAAAPDTAAAAQPEAQTTPAAQDDEESPPIQSGNSGAVIAALEGTLEQIYSEVNPSVVHIQVVAQGPNARIPNFPGLPDFNIPEGAPLQRGEGSGFIWDEEGHIVTNHHVVDGATEIYVTFADDTTVPATLVGSDRDSDLAVLRVEADEALLRPVRMGDSSAVGVGELAIAIGNPFGQEGSLTVGVISAIGRLLPVQTSNLGGPSYSIPDIIQTDAAINPGNSGGVLLNDQGEVIGVTTAIISPARVSAGIGFAVPATTVNKVVPALIEEGEYQHPYLGISGLTLTPDLAQAMDLDGNQRGALVVQVSPNSPASQAQLQPSEETVELQGRELAVGGDVITAFNGEAVRSMDDLITYLARSTEVGDTVTLTVLRDGEELDVEVTLEARPQQRPSEEEVVRIENNGAWLGIMGGALTTEVAETLGLPEDQEGVVVAAVAEGSPAAEAGLRGDIDAGEADVIIALDGEPVGDMLDLQRLLAQYEPGDEATLTILRDGEELELTVTLGQRTQ